MSTLRVNEIQTTGGLPNRGKILQIVQGVKTDRQVISGSSAFVNVTGLAANITPSFTSSKILIFLTIAGSSSDTGIKIRCQRNGSDVTSLYGDQGGASSQRSIGGHFWGGGSGGNSNAGGNLSACFLDSPASTGTLSYQIQAGTNSGTAAYVNTMYDSANAYYELRTASHITLFEVAA